MNAEAAARAWVDGWARAWAEHDAEAVAALYAPGALFVTHPFREPDSPLEYARRVFAGEDELLECRFAPPIASEDRAAVEWWAVSRAGSRETTLAGTSVLRFGPDGLCVEHREYWAEVDGRRPPPPGS